MALHNTSSRISGTATPPRTSIIGSRHTSLESSPTQYQQKIFAGDSTQQSRNSFRHTSSSSMQLLPPITSLDLLQASPFAVAMRKTEVGAGTAGEATNYNSDETRAASETVHNRQEQESNRMSNSSIPRMVLNQCGEGNDNVSSIAVSTLGGGSSNNPIQPPDSTMTIPDTHYSTHRNASLPEQKEETDELPFAVDEDDNTPLVSSASPSKSGSRSLWCSAKADAPEGGGDMAEISSSLAVSSLHHRCATDGKIRLKMFESTRTVESQSGLDLVVENAKTNENGGGSNVGDDGAGNTVSDYTSIKDQLSDFRSFGASLMVGSSDENRID